MALYNCMSWNVRRLISARFQCTSITNRNFRLFDRFTAYYNCISWNVKKLISPRIQWTRITNRVSSVFGRFTAHYNCDIFVKCLWHFSAEVSQIVFLAYLTVSRHITTVWPEMSENSYPRHFSAQVSQIVFLAYLTVLRDITTVYDLKCQKTHISAISVHKYHKSCF